MRYSEEIVKKVLNQYFGQFRYQDNFRPDWLSGLEIDRFYPELGVAIEFKGGQHFRPIPGMHGSEEAFRKQVSNNTKKRGLLSQKGYQLYALEIVDLDTFRLKNLLGRIHADAKRFAGSKNDLMTLQKLNTVRVDQPLDPALEREINKLSFQKNKEYFGPQPKREGWG